MEIHQKETFLSKPKYLNVFTESRNMDSTEKGCRDDGFEVGLSGWMLVYASG